MAFNIAPHRRTVRLPRPGGDERFAPPSSPQMVTRTTMSGPQKQASSENPFVNMISSAAPPPPPNSQGGLRVEQPGWYPGSAAQAPTGNAPTANTAAAPFGVTTTASAPPPAAMRTPAEATKTLAGLPPTGAVTNSTPTQQGPLSFALLSEQQQGPPPPQEAAPPPPTGQQPPPAGTPPPQQAPPPTGPRPGRVAAGEPILPDAESVFGMSLEEIQRMGGNADQYETILRWLNDGTARYGQEAMQVYADHLRRAPGIVSQYYADAERAAANGIEGMHFVDWLAYHNGPYVSPTADMAASPLAGRFGEASASAAAQWAQLKANASVSTTPNAPRNTPVNSSGGRWVGGTFVPDAPPAPPVPPPAAPPPTPPASTSPKPTDTRTPTPPPAGQSGGNMPPPAGTPPAAPPPAPNMSDLLAVRPDFRGLMRQVVDEYRAGVEPLFRSQREDVRNTATQSAALTGALRSGGFGEVLNDALQQQYANERATVAPEIANLQNEAQRRGIEQYQTDVSAILQREGIRTSADLERARQGLQERLASQQDALARFQTEMNAILTREGIQTNADLERRAQDIQKYGIDAGKLIEEYKAQMQLKGVQINANAQVDAAALHASAAQAAANAQAEASRYNAMLDYQAAIYAGDITRQRDVMQYILGWYGLAKDWADIVAGSDPLGILQPPPGDVVVVP